MPAASEQRKTVSVLFCDVTGSTALGECWTNEDLASVLAGAGRIDGARAALGRALSHWERKRCLPCVSRVREQIGSLERAAV